MRALTLASTVALILVTMLALLAGCIASAVATPDHAAVLAAQAADDATAKANVAVKIAQAQADKSVASAQAAASAAHDNVATLQGQLLTAQIEAKDADKAKADAVTEARLAPLHAILRVAECLALVAMILGVIDIIASMVWKIPFGETLGEGVLVSGVGVLALCLCLGVALSHVYMCLAAAIVPLIVWAYVVYRRQHKTIVAGTILAGAFHEACSALDTAAREGVAEGLKLFHGSVATSKGVSGIFQALLIKVHILKVPPVAPLTVPAPAAGK